MRLTVKVPEAFSLHQLIVSHGWSGLAPFGYNEARTELSYVDRLASGRIISYHLSQPRRHILVVLSDEVTSLERREVRRRLADILRVKLDLSAFYNVAAQEPKLLLAINESKGRMLCSATVFEDMVKTILTTNTTWSGTIRMNNNLVRSWGAGSGDLSDAHAFPAPADLAVVDVEELRKKAGLGYRAPYIKTLAQAVSSGMLDVEGFRFSVSDTLALRKELLAIDGIGPYAAATMLMLLGRYDRLPIDSWAMKLVSHEWHDGVPVKPADVEQAFEKWGEWKGLAYWFWDWKYLHDSVTGE